MTALTVAEQAGWGAEAPVWTSQMLLGANGVTVGADIRDAARARKADSPILTEDASPLLLAAMRIRLSLFDPRSVALATGIRISPLPGDTRINPITEIKELHIKRQMRRLFELLIRCEILALQQRVSTMT
jgi:hypothetical protein